MDLLFSIFGHRSENTHTFKYVYFDRQNIRDIKSVYEPKIWPEGAYSGLDELYGKEVTITVHYKELSPEKAAEVATWINMPE